VALNKLRIIRGGGRFGGIEVELNGINGCRLSGVVKIRTEHAEPEVVTEITAGRHRS
jgi:hypothetical protein